MHRPWSGVARCLLARFRWRNISIWWFVGQRNSQYAARPLHRCFSRNLWLLRRSFCARFSGLTHTLTHTAKRADGNSGNKRGKEHWFPSRKCWKRPEIVIFISFLLFVISRSPVQVRPLAPETGENREIFAGFLFYLFEFSGGEFAWPTPWPTRRNVQRAAERMFVLSFPLLCVFR